MSAKQWITMALAMVAIFTASSSCEKPDVCLIRAYNDLENYKQRVEWRECLVGKAKKAGEANGRNRPNKDDVNRACRDMGGEVIDVEDKDTACQKDADGGVFVVMYLDIDGDGYEDPSYGDPPSENPEITEDPPILLTPVEAEALCEEWNGTWVDGASPFCRLSSEGIAVVTEDANEDGKIGSQEAHCEGLDGNGDPSGEQVACF